MTSSAATGQEESKKTPLAEEEESKDAVAGLPVDPELSKLSTSVDADSKIKLVPWSPQQENDPNLPHCHRNVHSRSVSLNNRLYVFQNLSPENDRAIKVIDPSLRRIF